MNSGVRYWTLWKEKKDFTRLTDLQLARAGVLSRYKHKTIKNLKINMCIA